MSLVSGQREYTGFVQGFITEANPLSFPPNASIDEQNFNLLKTGERPRRLGMDFETNYSLIDSTLSETDFSNSALTTALWQTTGENGDLTIFVVQIGTKLWFFDANASPVSGSILNGGDPIDIYGDPSQVMDASNINGKFIIANNQKGVTVLDYNPSTDSVTASARIILVRDIWGIGEDVSVSSRPTSLSVDHEYNLVNQGWGYINEDDPKKQIIYRNVYRELGAYPSNADVAGAGKDPTSHDKFNIEFLVRAIFGTTPAPKGFFVLDAFRRGLSRSTLFTGKTFNISSDYSVGDPFALTNFLNSTTDWEYNYRLNTSASFNTDASLGGIKTTESFAGRIWYTGADYSIVDGYNISPNLGSYVFFSQVVDGDDKITRCYQENDPTSDESPDLLDSDGGAVKIPDMKNASKLISIGRHLVVFAQNGVWSISGGETNFSATNFEINRVSNVKAVSPEAIIEVEGSIMFWAEEGIYVISSDQVTSRLVAQNITQTTIQSFYDSLSSQSKRHAKCVFDSVERKVRWLYNSDPDFSDVTFVNKYDGELVFDIVLKAFYKYSIGSTGASSPYLAGSDIVPEFTITVFEDTVVDSNGDVVVDSNGQTVVIQKSSKRFGRTKTKYLAVVPSADAYKFTFASYNDVLFRDWASYDTIGVDAFAYLLTGYDSFFSADNENKDTQLNKQVSYITCHFARTETGFEYDENNNIVLSNPSACKMQSQWSFSDSLNSGKWGPEQQVYRLLRPYIPSGVSDPFDYGQSVVTTKNKLRGRGRVLSLLFKSEPEKDLRMYGWGVKYTGASNV